MGKKNGITTQLDSDNPALYVARTEPDYERACQCGDTPTVVGLDETGKEIWRPGLCGPCAFGTTKALDPEWWNEHDY